MKQLSIFFIAGILLYSCTRTDKKVKGPVVHKVTEDSIETKLDTSTMLVISQPDVFDDNDRLIFTVDYNTIREGRGFLEKIGSSYDSYSDGHYSANIRNVIFSNHRNGESHLLCDTNLYIEAMNYVFPDSIEEAYKENRNNRYASSPQFILYTIRLPHEKKDKKGTSDDPRVLFLSDADGKNFMPLFPLDEDLWSWTLIDKKKQLLVYTCKDSNHDLKFDAKDKINIRVIALKSPASSKNYFGKEFLKKLYQIEPKL